MSPDFINRREDREANKAAFNKTLLDIAIDKNAVRSVALLIEKGANINVLPTNDSKKNGSPLGLAVLEENMAIIKLLLAKGADPNGGYRSPLSIATTCKKTGVDIAKILIAAGADINKESTAANISPLKSAVLQSNRKVYDFLISKGATIEPDIILSIQTVPVGVGICQDLIKRGVNINFANKDGNVLHTLLDEVFQKKNLKKSTIDIINILSAAGINWHQKNVGMNEPLQEFISFFLLSKSTSEIFKPVVELCLSKGADINAVGPDGYTQLYTAFNDRNMFVLKHLIDLGANVNISLTGLAPLYIAVKNNWLLEVDLLCSSPTIDVNITGPHDVTPLLLATIWNFKDIMRKLVKLPGIDVNKLTTAVGAPLYQVKDAESIKILIDAGADINLHDHIGRTPLYFAAIVGKEDIFRALLTVPHIDTEILYDGSTILEMASQNRFDKNPAINAVIVKLLKKPEKLWEGWTSADLGKFDTVFEPSANAFSCCPVCLKYVEREDGCMYMREHNCSAFGDDYYHKELYTKYKSDSGYIYWCTICRRIALGHRHYDLAAAIGPKAELIGGGGDPFANDCSIDNEGGGPKEKVARFRRLREYARDLQEEVGKKTFSEAMNELVEEMWNAPLSRKPVVKKIIETKKWNINASEFPAPLPPPPERVINFALFPNIVQDVETAAANLSTTLVGFDSIGQEDNQAVIQFHHVQPDGGVFNHEGNYISVESLVLIMKVIISV